MWKKKLKKSGAKVYIGHRNSNINNANLIVVSSAIDLKNPEIIEAKKNSITIIPRAEMLGSLMFIKMPKLKFGLIILTFPQKKLEF